MAKKPPAKKKTAPKATASKSKPKKGKKKIKFTLTAQGEAEVMDSDEGGGTPG
jgi:hypothetical protein